MVTTELFCRVWNASSSNAEAARILGMTLGSATTWASNLRKKGVALKSFKTNNRGGSKMTVEEINAAAQR